MASTAVLVIAYRQRQEEQQQQQQQQQQQRRPRHGWNGGGGAAAAAAAATIASKRRIVLCVLLLFMSMSACASSSPAVSSSSSSSSSSLLRSVFVVAGPSNHLRQSIGRQENQKAWCLYRGSRSGSGSNSGPLCTLLTRPSNRHRHPFEIVGRAIRQQNVFLCGPTTTTVVAPFLSVASNKNNHSNHKNNVPSSPSSSSSSSDSAWPFWYTVRVGLAGGLAGAFGTALLHPIDAAKTMRQANPTHFTSVRAALKSLLLTPSTASLSSSTGRSVRRTTSMTMQRSRASMAAAATTTTTTTASTRPMVWQRLNLGRAYAGGWTATLGAIPSSALYFGTYESVKTWMKQKVRQHYSTSTTTSSSSSSSSSSRHRTDDSLFDPNDRFLSRFIIHAAAAASGNVMSSAVFVPKELIKQQMQYSGSKSIVRTIGQLIQDRGMAGLYCGYRATLMRNVPSAMLRFVIYEELKWAWYTKHERQQQTTTGSGGAADAYRPIVSWKLLVAGAVAGALASGAMTPVDVVKTRFSTGTCPLNDVKGCFQHIVKEQGWQGLYAGAGSRMAVSGTFSALGFWSFEVAKSLLGVADVPPPPPPSPQLQGHGRSPSKE